MSEKNTESSVAGVSVKQPVKKHRDQPELRGTRDLSERKVQFKQEGTRPRKVPGHAATPADENTDPSSKNANRNRGANGARRSGGKKNDRRNNDRVVSEFEERVLDIARVTTVVKGGRRFSFSAFVVIGNKKGKVGFGHGKANEVPDAIKKAIRNAQTNLVTVPIIDKHTVPHDSTGKFLSSKVLIKPAPKGKGMIASGTVRAVTELAGYSDIYAKTYGSRAKTNTAKATIQALLKMRTAEEIAELRDVSVEALKSKVAA